MRTLVRTILEVSAILIVTGATLFVCFWLMRAYLGLSLNFTVAVMAATVVLLVPTLTYGYYIGWVQHRLGETAEGLARVGAFKQRFRMAIFLGVIAVPLLVAAWSFLIARNATVGVLCLVLSLFVTPWALRKIKVTRGVVRET